MTAVVKVWTSPKSEVVSQLANDYLNDNDLKMEDCEITSTVGKFGTTMQIVHEQKEVGKEVYLVFGGGRRD